MKNTVEKRYCKLSNYNELIILKKVRELLKKAGAKIIENKDFIDLEMHVYTDETDQKKIKAIESIKPIICKGYRALCEPNYTLEFILNGYYYKITYDENPFFDIHYCKIKIDENGNYTGKRYFNTSDEINNKSWAKNKQIAFSIAYDNLYKICSNDELTELANDQLKQIQQYVINGQESEKISKKVREYYGSHYKYVYKYECSKCNIYDDFSNYGRENYDY